ncbi:HeH/LEM domain-containing protein [Pseudomonas asiatica]|uniref:HeH/LEM domain-containing protein n=1 Tax=Pseudomonas asiatica TaxID=2219225 RepID=UPI002E7AD5DC|nr:HeH/LEM domain-containing protein [Pseudomonas asiatica]MEE1920181.1 HeH/LEM domain-containing protein [Pseudomonas asiatica]
MPIISVKKAFPFAVDGNKVVEIHAGEQDVSERCALVAVEHLGVAEYLDRQSASGPRDDGPTVAEWVEAGYLAANYPPDGYASRSSQEEIDAAIELQKGAENETDPLKMTVPKLKEWLTANNIPFDASMKKPELQALVPKND